MKYLNRYSHVIRRLDLSIVSFGTKTLPLNYTLIIIFKRDCEILHCDFDEQRLNYFLKNKNENNCYYYKADKIRINGEKFKYLWIEIHGKIKIWRSTRNLKMMKIKNYEIR